MPKERDPETVIRDLQVAYRAAFGTDDGKVVLDDLRRRYFDRLSYEPGDPHATAFNEGARGVFHYIRRMLTADAPK